MKKFNQARVNGGSNYDSLKVARESTLVYIARGYLHMVTLVTGMVLAKSLREAEGCLCSIKNWKVFNAMNNGADYKIPQQQR